VKRSPVPPIAAGRSLADTAYRQLEELLVTLKLQPGSVVTEADLVRRTGIGRTPIREAIQRFETQSLLVPLPRRGVMIPMLQINEFLTLLETRKVLDRLIAASAARKASREERMALQACAAGMQRAAARGDLTTFISHDRDFDEIVERAARNPFAVQAVAPLHTHCRRFWFTYREEGDLQRAARLHGTLMTAIARGNVPAAERASDALIVYMEQFVRSTING
jgi:DNA-binding GntR family transcriptional regulator